MLVAMTVNYRQTHLITVCRMGAKCFSAYFSSVLGSIAPQKSRPSINDKSLTHVQDGFIHTFSNAGGVEFTREVPEILYLIAKIKRGQ
jgi:hypothetical protein